MTQIKNKKQEISKYQKQYYEDNKQELSEYNQQYTKNRIKTDPAFKLRSYVSHAIGSGLKRNGTSKSGNSIIKYLLYSFADLKIHLELQFEPWMTWENHGKYVVKTWDDSDQSTWCWNIDHIIPQSKFYFISMEDLDFTKCWALDNLRPLSAKQNILEGGRNGFSCGTIDIGEANDLGI